MLARRRSIHPALLFAAALLQLAAPARGEDLERLIDVEPGGVLEVDLDLGEGLRPDPGQLEVRSHDAATVRILADASGWGAYGVRFRVFEDPSGVRLLGRVSGTGTWLFGGPRIEVQVWVPRSYSVDVRTSAGTIRLEDLGGRVRARGESDLDVIGVQGPVRLRTGGGTLRLADIEGAVDARTASGDVRVRSVDGDIDVRSGWGAIEVERASAALVARTDRGNIELVDVVGPVEAKTERGTIYASFVGNPAGSLETQRGALEVALPATASAQVEARTARGSVEVANAFATTGRRGEDHATVSLNGGGAPLRLYSQRGGVRVRPR